MASLAASEMAAIWNGEWFLDPIEVDRLRHQRFLGRDVLNRFEILFRGQRPVRHRIRLKCEGCGHSILITAELVGQSFPIACHGVILSERQNESGKNCEQSEPN